MKRYKKKLTIKNNKKRNTYKRRTMRQKKLSGGNDILKSLMPSPPKHKPRSNRLRSIKGVNPSRNEIDKAVNKAVAHDKSSNILNVFKNATIAASLPDIEYVSPHKKNNKTQKNTNIQNDLEKKLRDLRNNRK